MSYMYIYLYKCLYVSKCSYISILLATIAHCIIFCIVCLFCSFVKITDKTFEIRVWRNLLFNRSFASTLLLSFTASINFSFILSLLEAAAGVACCRPSVHSASALIFQFTEFA